MCFVGLVLGWIEANVCKFDILLRFMLCNKVCIPNFKNKRKHFRRKHILLVILIFSWIVIVSFCKSLLHVVLNGLEVRWAPPNRRSEVDVLLCRSGPPGRAHRNRAHRRRLLPEHRRGARCGWKMQRKRHRPGTPDPPKNDRISEREIASHRRKANFAPLPFHEWKPKRVESIKSCNICGFSGI